MPIRDLTPTTPGIARRGFCAYRDEKVPNDCAAGQSGGWSLNASASASLDSAEVACMQLCGTCSRCRFASFSARHKDCSWFAGCAAWPDKLLDSVPGFATVRRRIPGFATAASTRRAGLGDDGRLRTLVVLVGSLRGGEPAWQSLARNMLEPNRADLALSLGYFASRGQPAPASSSLLQRAKFVWWTEEVEDWGVYFDALGNSTAWRQVVADVRRANGGSIGFAGHCGLGGSHVDGVRVPGTAGINFALRWRAAARFEALGLAEQYDRLVVTRTDHYYACRLDLDLIEADAAAPQLGRGRYLEGTEPNTTLHERLPQQGRYLEEKDTSSDRETLSPSTDEEANAALRRVYVPEGEDWYGINDRFIMCRGALMLSACLAMIEPIITHTAEHKAALSYSGEGYNRYLLSHFHAELHRFPRNHFLIGQPLGARVAGDRNSPLAEVTSAFSHAPSETPDEVFGLHVKYAAEYRLTLRTCFHNRDVSAFSVRRVRQ